MPISAPKRPDWQVILDKLNKYWLALGWVWNGQYNQIKEPLLAALFFYGFVVCKCGGIAIGRRAFGGGCKSLHC